MKTIPESNADAWWPAGYTIENRLASQAWLACRADGMRAVVKPGAVPEALLRLRAPHLAQVIAGGADWHALAWLEGEPLDALLARAEVALPQALRWMEELLTGLAALHGAGLVHRDVKPANLLVTRGGTLVVADFGLACAPGPCAVHGTPASTAPEQWRGNVSAAADLFAAGVLLYRLLAGHQPFHGAPFAAMQAILAGRYAPLPRPVALYDGIVQKALAGDPALRFADAAAFRAALRAVGPVAITS